MRHARLVVATLVVLSGAVAGVSAAGAEEPRTPLPAPDKGGWIALFNGRDLTGWHFKNPKAKRVWVACSEVRIDPANPARLLPFGSGGGTGAVLLFGDDGRGSDIMTDHDFYNYELHIEFTVPKGSNSGIYNRGLYEIQVLDSYGKSELAVHDCGALYERTIPKVNASKPPGEWQTFDIKMQGKQMSLVWNGVEILRDYDVRYGETDQGAFERLNKENASKPEALRVKLEARDGRYVGYFGEGGTRSSLPGVDRAGPILLQGDHGPVAYRHIKIRPLAER